MELVLQSPLRDWGRAAGTPSLGVQGSQGAVLGASSCPHSELGSHRHHQGPKGRADGCPAPCPSCLPHQCCPLIPCCRFLGAVTLPEAETGKHFLNQ